MASFAQRLVRIHGGFHRAAERLGSIRGSVPASGAAWAAWVMSIAPGLRAASEEKSFMVSFVSGLHTTAELAREEGLPLLSNDQSDDRSAVRLWDR